jgi:hypothetical protein
VEMVYLHPQRLPYGGPEWKESLANGRLDVCIAGIRCKVRVDGEIDGHPRFVINVPDNPIEGYPAEVHGKPGFWYPIPEATRIMVEEAAQAALGEVAEKKLERVKRDQALIENELLKVADEMGLIDFDVLHMAAVQQCKVIDTPDGPKVQGVREILEAFRREKPHFFKPRKLEKKAE